MQLDYPRPPFSWLYWLGQSFGNFGSIQWCCSVVKRAEQLGYRSMHLEQRPILSKRPPPPPPGDQLAVCGEGSHPHFLPSGVVLWCSPNQRPAVQAKKLPLSATWCYSAGTWDAIGGMGNANAGCSRQEWDPAEDQACLGASVVIPWAKMSTGTWEAGTSKLLRH